MWTGQDRTEEWWKILSDLSSDATSLSTVSHNSDRILQRSNFTLAAKNVNKNVYQTLCKLERLTKLAEKQTLFEDHTRDIQELSYVIKQDLAELSKMIIQLQSLSSQYSSRSRSGQERQHSQNLVKNFGNRLSSMRNGFEQQLKLYWSRLKVQEDRKSKLLGSSNDEFCNERFPITSAESTTEVSVGSILPSRLIEDEVRAKNVGGMNLETEEHFRVDLTQQMMPSDGSSTFYNSRVSAMGSIESTILDLGRIFSQIASIVAEQEDSVARIDTAVDNADSHLQASQTELTRYLQGVSSNRWLMLKLFGVLVFVVLFVVLFS